VIRTSRLASVAVALAILAATAAGAETSKAPGPAPRQSPAPAEPSLGIVFSATNILLDVESYEGGIGAKFAKGDLCLRGAFDFLLSGASNTFSVNVGATGEYHLSPGRISPYVGAFAELGYMRQGGLMSAVPFSLGAVAGVEVFVFDFLSVFAEYCLACDLTLTTDLQTSQTTFDYVVDTRMGNSSKLGITVYLTGLSLRK
jgi:hypothetical protein